jgi:hypothetical protein
MQEEKEEHENTKEESTKKRVRLAPSVFRLSCFRVPLLILLVSSLIICNSQLARGQAVVSDELKDITGIEEPARPPARPWWPYVFGLSAVVIMSLFFVGWRYYRRYPNKAELGPSAWALAELQRLESLAGNANQEQMQGHPEMLSQVIRVYLEKRFQLRAPRQTTPEFLRGIKDSTVLTAGHRELLKDFLERCDLSKFANLQFPLEECRALARSARKFVEETAETA